MFAEVAVVNEPLRVQVATSIDGAVKLETKQCFYNGRISTVSNWNSSRGDFSYICIIRLNVAMIVQIRLFWSDVKIEIQNA